MTIREQIIAQVEAFYYFIKVFVLDDESWKVSVRILGHGEFGV